MAKDVAVTVTLPFTLEEYVMILSYFEESLLKCYRFKDVKVTNVHQQPASDFDDKIPLNTIVCAKSIMGKCIDVLAYLESLKEKKDDVPKMPQEDQERKPEQDQKG